MCTFVILENSILVFWGFFYWYFASVNASLICLSVALHSLVLSYTKNKHEEILLFLLQVRPLKCLQNLEAMLKKHRSNPSSRSASIPSTRWIIIQLRCRIFLLFLFFRMRLWSYFLAHFYCEQNCKVPGL